MMDTKVLRLDDESYALSIEEAANALRNGNLVAFPTETVYGLGANADDTEAVARLYEVKQRPREKQIGLLVCSLDGVKLWVQTIPPNAKLLMERFWPGPLTIVLPGRTDRNVCPTIKGGNEVGLRFPDSKVAQDIVRLAKVPVVATSANISEMPPPINAEQVIRDLSGRIELILDGGVTCLQAPSTVVRVTSANRVEIIRIGVISRKMIYNCLKQKQVISEIRHSFGRKAL
ncbi:MAG: threonylcarbamoyl-AMP synthase [Chloroflexi bacterium]|nr:threonylcarbamoyl-AMP synthase [Chloroflexota bacterium]